MHIVLYSITTYQGLSGFNPIAWLIQFDSVELKERVDGHPLFNKLLLQGKRKYAERLKQSVYYYMSNNLASILDRTLYLDSVVPIYSIVTHIDNILSDVKLIHRINADYSSNSILSKEDREVFDKYKVPNASKKVTFGYNT